MTRPSDRSFEMPSEPTIEIFAPVSNKQRNGKSKMLMLAKGLSSFNLGDDDILNKLLKLFIVDCSTDCSLTLLDCSDRDL